MNRVSDVGMKVRSLIGESVRDSLPAGIDDPDSVRGMDDAVDTLADKVISLMKSGIRIKTCPDCGSVFATVKANQRFCRSECSRAFSLKSAKSDPALACYNRAYKAMSARLSRRRISREHLDSWRQIARLDLERYHAGDISLDDFKKRVAHGIRRWERVTVVSDDSLIESQRDQL